MKRWQRRGYTIIEVMAALGILTIGATFVVALQKMTQVANMNARNIATANTVALSWAERLRVDALQWNDTAGGDLGDTRWIQQATTNWFSPAIVDQTASNRADILGADLFNNDTAAPAFCTHIRLTQLYPTLIRAEIRTVWIRTGVQIDCSVPPANIDSDPTKANSIGYGAVYVTTALMANVVPGG